MSQLTTAKSMYTLTFLPKTLYTYLLMISCRGLHSHLLSVTSFSEAPARFFLVSPSKCRPHAYIFKSHCPIQHDQCSCARRSSTFKENWKNATSIVDKQISYPILIDGPSCRHVSKI